MYWCRRKYFIWKTVGVASLLFTLTSARITPLPSFLQLMLVWCIYMHIMEIRKLLSVKLLIVINCAGYVNDWPLTQSRNFLVEENINLRVHM